MNITIHRDATHSVTIQGDFTGPYINLEISPAHAYDLLRALDAKREEIKELAMNYYDCADCGETHPKSMTVCPR